MRFLGCKVYLAVTVVLVTVLRHGPSPPRLRLLREQLGVDPATVARWRVWWRDAFAESPFGRSLRALVPQSLGAACVPAALLASFSGSLLEQLLALLRLLTPCTTRDGLAAHAF